MMTVGVIIGSSSDWPAMKNACDVLDHFSVDFEKKVLTAHRSAGMMVAYARNAHTNGIEVTIAGAGGAAHLPGMVASLTSVPVIGIPIESKALQGMDSLLSIVQMPGGIPVATTAIGKAGSKNAGILAARMLAVNSPELYGKLDDYQKSLEDKVGEMQDDL